MEIVSFFVVLSLFIIYHSVGICKLFSWLHIKLGCPYLDFLHYSIPWFAPKSVMLYFIHQFIILAIDQSYERCDITDAWEPDAVHAQRGVLWFVKVDNRFHAHLPNSRRRADATANGTKCESSSFAKITLMEIARLFFHPPPSWSAAASAMNSLLSFPFHFCARAYNIQTSLFPFHSPSVCLFSNLSQFSGPFRKFHWNYHARVHNAQVLLMLLIMYTYTYVNTNISLHHCSAFYQFFR